MKKQLLLLAIILTTGLNSFAKIIHTVLTPSGSIAYSSAWPPPLHEIYVAGSNMTLSYTDYFGIHITDNYNSPDMIYTNGWDDLKLFTKDEAIDGSHALNTDGGTALGFLYAAGAEPAGIHYIGFKTSAGQNGWIKINVTPSVKYEILEYAYEYQIGKAINAGDNGIVTSVSNVKKEINVTAYPNPTNGIVNLDLGDLSNVSIKVLNHYGQIIQNINNVSLTSYQLNIEGAPGVYMVEVSAQNSIKTIKVLKK